MAKVHLRDTIQKPEDWTQSPHIKDAIEKGEWTSCHTIMFDKRITSNTSKVTCIRCLENIKKEN